MDDDAVVDRLLQDAAVPVRDVLQRLGPHPRRPRREDVAELVRRRRHLARLRKPVNFCELVNLCKLVNLANDKAPCG